MISPKFLEVFATLSKMQAADLQAKFKNTEGEDLSEDEAAGVLKEVFSSRFHSFKEEVEGAATRKTLTKLEKQLKEKFGVDSQAQGIDLVNAIVESEKAKFKPTPAEVDFSKWDEEKWAEQEAFRNAARKAARLHEEEANRVKAEFEAYKNQETTRQHNQSVMSALAKKLQGMNPNGLQNAATAQKKVDDFLKSNFDPKKLKFDGDELVVLDDEGNVMKDKTNLYEPIKAENLLKTLWYDGFNTVPAQNNPPAPNGSTATVNGMDSTLKQKIDACYKNGDSNSYMALIRTLQPTQKTAAMKYWSELSKK